MNYESLGSFYLGREVDAASGADRAEPLLYDSRDLTTHAVCLGMTGSGKTGLCLSLLEEAAIDGIPTIAIDPKGDLSNLLLTFPELQPKDFAPWIDAAEAARQGVTPDVFAKQTADKWREGLAQWDQDGERIRRFKESAEVLVYTPGSDAGEPLSVLRSFSAPTAEALTDASALRERVAASVSGLLGLVGIDADPMQSREHILLSSVFTEAWSLGHNLDLATIIQSVQKPSFDKVGVFDLETFYPSKDRLRLAMALNNLIAAPGFSAWMHGAPLDIQRMLTTDSGKPRIVIVSIAHLNDAERMFVVTLVLTELVAWMRRQSGTSSLRALLYMDEIFGYFPPTAMPPAKLPLLTLMKQARAFGLGVVLATQNPVDLDYKGLSNAGTWFIGRLQTQRDKDRVIEGLLSTGERGLDKSQLDALLANLSARVFLMRNVHEEAPVLFRTRWALSYLRGPLTLQEIARLKQPQTVAPLPKTTRSDAHSALADGSDGAALAAKPVVAADIREYYWIASSRSPLYTPHVLAVVRMHFVDRKAGVGVWETRAYLGELMENGIPAWGAALPEKDVRPHLQEEAAEGARYIEPPAALLRSQNYRGWKKQLQGHVYESAELKMLRCPSVGQTMVPGDDEAGFRARIALAVREKRDAEIERLRNKYAPRLVTLQDQLRRAQDRIERERAQVSDRKMQTAVSLGTSLIGALFGRKRISVTSAGRMGSAARSAGRIGREQDDVRRAEESQEIIDRRLSDLEQALEQDIAELRQQLDPSRVEIEEIAIKPRKSDIEVLEIALVWRAIE